MNKSTFILVLLSAVYSPRVFAQQETKQEYYGNTLNIGAGIGYYSYVGHSTPVIHADYEIGVVRNFTLAPFISYSSYQDNYYWGDAHNPYREYSYRETVIPAGVKGTYYFDQLLGAGPRWDFYLAASLGFELCNTSWSDGYGGNTTLNNGPGTLFLDLHIGTEYHFSKKTGLFVDLSTGVSTLGLAFHF